MCNPAKNKKDNQYFTMILYSNTEQHYLRDMQNERILDDLLLYAV